MKFRHGWAGAVLSVATLAMSSVVNAWPVVFGQGTWETTLQGRDLDGNLSTFEAYYDTALNITWLADANYAMTSGYDADGYMDWNQANAWAASLNPYGSGITGWRLPTTIDADGSDADTLGNDGCSQPSISQGIDCGFNITIHSEMSHMFYVTLGNKAYYDTSGNSPQAGWGLTNTGPFNVRALNYWSATEYAPNANDAWLFNFHYGLQGYANKTDTRDTWAVYSGDVGVAVVPVPTAIWFFCSGLTALIAFASRRAKPRMI